MITVSLCHGTRQKHPKCVHVYRFAICSGRNTKANNADAVRNSELKQEWTSHVDDEARVSVIERQPVVREPTEPFYVFCLLGNVTCMLYM